MRKTYFIVSVLAMCVFCSLALAQEDNNADDFGVRDMPPDSLLPNSGHCICTAAINSDGTVAGGHRVNPNPAETQRLYTGNYEVDFKKPCLDVRAKLGYMRILQVDTLTTGVTDPVFCTTADRAGDYSSVYVICFDADGNEADTSFFLMITR